MLFGDPILKNNFTSSIVKGHLDTKKYSFLVNIPSLYGEKHAILMGVVAKTIIPLHYMEKYVPLWRGFKKMIFIPFSLRGF